MKTFNGTTWEWVAGLQICEQNYCPLLGVQEELEIPEPVSSEFDALPFDRAFRGVEKSQQYYGAALASLAGLKYRDRPLTTGVEAASDGPIVLCPFAIRPEMALPASLWRALLLYLRGYPQGVVLIGDRDQRPQPGFVFAENDILCAVPLEQKLKALASATCIVGVPNAWTWFAETWKKKTVLFQPETIPVRRWLPLEYDDQHMFLYPGHAVQIPIFLTALKKIMRAF